jgi:hypothetical protein
MADLIVNAAETPGFFFVPGLAATEIAGASSWTVHGNSDEKTDDRPKPVPTRQLIALVQFRAELSAGQFSIHLH